MSLPRRSGRPPSGRSGSRPFPFFTPPQFSGQDFFCSQKRKQFATPFFLGGPCSLLHFYVSPCRPPFPWRPDRMMSPLLSWLYLSSFPARTPCAFAHPCGPFLLSSQTVPLTPNTVGISPPKCPPPGGTSGVPPPVQGPSVPDALFGFSRSCFSPFHRAATYDGTAFSFPRHRVFPARKVVPKQKTLARHFGLLPFCTGLIEKWQAFFLVFFSGPHPSLRFAFARKYQGFW